MKTLVIALALTLSTNAIAAPNLNEDCMGWLLERFEMDTDKLGMEMVRIAHGVDRTSTSRMLRAVNAGTADGEKFGYDFGIACMIEGQTVGETMYQALTVYRDTSV